MAVGFEEGPLLDEALQVLHLRPVGRDDAHVDAVVEDALLAHALEVDLQQAQCQVGLSFVDAPEGLSDELLLEIVLFRRFLFS